MRTEEFEKIEAIARHLAGGYIVFDGSKYVLGNQELLKSQMASVHNQNVAWMNGAYFMWLEKCNASD